MRRLLPLLLLTALLGASCGEGSPGSGPEQGTVRGTVLLGPMCPVEVAGSPCPDEPLAGVIVQAVAEPDLVVATARSDAQGHFSLVLAPGVYVVRAVPEDDQVRTSESVSVTVEVGETAEVTIPVDSGIR